MRRIPFVLVLSFFCGPVFGQSDSLVDVFPLAINNQWTFGYAYEWGDDPAHNPMWQWSDTGTVTTRITAKTMTQDSTRWLAQETGSHWTRFNGGPWSGPGVQRDSFEIVEHHSGNHLMYRTGNLANVRRSVLPFMPNLVDTAKVYRYARVDATGIKTVRSHEIPIAPIYTFRFQQGVGLVTVVMSDGCTCFPFFSTNHVLRSFVITGIGNQPIETTVQGFRLDQNYPNPFNPSTEIRFDLPTKSHVRVSLYNILGEELSALVNEERAAGSYRIQWNAGQHASGVYFLRMTAISTEGWLGTIVSTRKMLLLK